MGTFWNRDEKVCNHDNEPHYSGYEAGCCIQFQAYIQISQRILISTEGDPECNIWGCYYWYASKFYSINNERARLVISLSF